MKLNITNKSYYAVIFIILGIITLKTVAIYNSYKIFQESVEQKYQTLTQLKVDHIQTAISQMAADVAVLSNFKSLHYCVKNTCMDGPHFEEAKKDLLNFAYNYQQYTQIRVLNKQGLELIRWNYDSATETLTQAKLLQDKSNRYYFKKSEDIPVGSTYVSKLDHNIENGELQVPLVPTIRVVHKISLGNTEYLVVLNRDISPSLDADVGHHLQEFVADKPFLRALYQIDAQSHNIENEMQFAPLFSVTENAQASSLKDMPNFIKKLELSNFKINQSTLKRDPSGTLIVWHQPILKSSLRHKSANFVIVAHIPKSYIFNAFWIKNSNIILLQIILTSIVIMLLIALQMKSSKIQRNEVKLDSIVGQLREALQKVQSSQTKQAQMLSVVSHEFRTPLASTSMIYKELNHKSLDQYLPTLRSNNERVLSIMDDLSMVIRPNEKNVEEKKELVPALLVEKAILSLSGLAEKNKIKAQLLCGELSKQKILFCTSSLRQIVTNLTLNSIIHSKGQNIWVSIQVIPRNNNQATLKLRVEDDGQGISPEHQNIIFEAFSRGDSDEDGTGMGLYIVKKLAESLQGKVQYFDSEYGGAGFEFTTSELLQLDNEVSNQNKYTDEQLKQTLKDKNILFAEDQHMIQVITNALLTKAGAKVIVCDNGRIATEAYKESNPDIVITDAMMPEMDGYEFAKQLRTFGYKGPIIAVTGATLGQEQEVLLEAGVDIVLSKPLNLNMLKHALADWEQKHS